jgi:hypothetical protein
MADNIKLPPGYEDATPVQTTDAGVQLPPGYEDAKPVIDPYVANRPGVQRPKVEVKSSEGPIAQGLATFETKLADVPRGVYDSIKNLPEDYKRDAGKSFSESVHALPGRIKALNPIATTEGSLPMNIGATVANIAPLALDTGGEGISESPLGSAFKTTVRGTGKAYNVAKDVAPVVAPVAGAVEGGLKGGPVGSFIGAATGGTLGKIAKIFPRAPESVTQFGLPKVKPLTSLTADETAAVGDNIKAIASPASALKRIPTPKTAPAAQTGEALGTLPASAKMRPLAATVPAVDNTPSNLRDMTGRTSFTDKPTAHQGTTLEMPEGTVLIGKPLALPAAPATEVTSPAAEPVPEAKPLSDSDYRALEYRVGTDNAAQLIKTPQGVEKSRQLLKGTNQDYADFANSQGPDHPKGPDVKWESKDMGRGGVARSKSLSPNKKMIVDHAINNVPHTEFMEATKDWGK